MPRIAVCNYASNPTEARIRRLACTFGDIRGQEQILATAQVVMTAVSYPGIDRVHISLDGVSADVPFADGTLASRPLVRSDYEQLLLPAPTASSASASS